MFSLDFLYICNLNYKQITKSTTGKDENIERNNFTM